MTLTIISKYEEVLDPLIFGVFTKFTKPVDQSQFQVDGKQLVVHQVHQIRISPIKIQFPVDGQGQTLNSFEKI